MKKITISLALILVLLMPAGPLAVADTIVKASVTSRQAGRAAAANLSGRAKQNKGLRHS